MPVSLCPIKLLLLNHCLSITLQLSGIVTWINLLTRTRTWMLSELFVCTCHCFQTDKVKQDKMNLDKIYIILKV